MGKFNKDDNNKQDKRELLASLKEMSIEKHDGDNGEQ